VEQQSLPRFSVATSHFSLFPFPPFISLLTRPYASEGFADAKHVMTRRVYWKCPKGSKGMFFFFKQRIFQDNLTTSGVNSRIDWLWKSH
jgi:hypothetical protein